MIPGLPQLSGRQKEVLYLPPSGHTVVLGTAGSGKTILAIHRAAYLANQQTDHGGRTLLLTFNKCLVSYLNHLGGHLLNVDARNYHEFARGYLASRGKMEWNCICDAVEFYTSQAVEAIREAGVQSSVLSRPVRFLTEEFRWIAQNGLRSLPEYLAAERVGRAGARVTRADRPVVWAVYAKYLELRAEAGKLYDWDDLAQTVHSEFKGDTGARMYRHIVIDEGQDFSPVMIRSLAAAMPSDGSLTFFGDMAQQIYGNKLSWRSADLEVRESWKFEDNYRNTKQIAQLALALARTPYYKGISDLVIPKDPIASGPPPVLVTCRSEDAEIKFIGEFAERFAETGTVGVLFRDRALEKRLLPVLSTDPTRLHRELKRWPSGTKIFYGTYHAAKGLEFDSVLLPFLSATRLPHPPDVAALGYEEAAAQDAKLLYVGLTRAKLNLVMTHSGAPTPLLPSDPGLVMRRQQ